MKFISTGQGAFKKIGLIIISGLIYSTANSAVPPVSEEKGWSGFVAAGAGWADITSNTAAGNKLLDLDEDPWSGTNTEADSRSQTFPIAGGEVTWTLGGRNAVFFGTSLIDQLTQSGVMQAGWRKSTDSAGTFQVGVLKNPTPTPSRVYTDPFNDDGFDRAVTDRKSTGIRLAWGQIFNTGFEVALTALNYEIDNERSGQFFGVDGVDCDAACQALLDREGDLAQLEVNYLFTFGDGKHLLRPGVTFSDFDADGNANDYDGAVAKVTYSWLGLENFTFVSNVSAGERDFDTANPIFADQQDTDIFVIDASVIYALPFGTERRWQLIANVLYGEGDSDIDFYNQEVTKVGATVLYRFGNLRSLKK